MNAHCRQNIQCVMHVRLLRSVSIPLVPMNVSVPLCPHKPTNTLPLPMQNSGMSLRNRIDRRGNFRLRPVEKAPVSLRRPPMIVVRRRLPHRRATLVVKIFNALSTLVRRAIVPQMHNVIETTRPWRCPITNVSVHKDSWEVDGPVNPRIPSQHPKLCLMELRQQKLL
jgi:hypothetical protein